MEQHFPLSGNTAPGEPGEKQDVKCPGEWRLQDPGRPLLGFAKKLIAAGGEGQSRGWDWGAAGVGR